MPHTLSALADDPFSQHVVRLFAQLSAMAMLKLHVESCEHGPESNARTPELCGKAVHRARRAFLQRSCFKRSCEPLP